MKLFVAGLPYDMDDQEFLQIFEQFGVVGSAKVILDKETQKSRGFGFVEMSKKEDAEAAIRELNGYEMDGRTLAVKAAEDRKPSAGGSGGGRPGGGGGDRGGFQPRGGGDRKRY